MQEKCVGNEEISDSYLDQFIHSLALLKNESGKGGIKRTCSRCSQPRLDSSPDPVPSPEKKLVPDC